MSADPDSRPRAHQGDESRIVSLGRSFANLAVAELYEEALRRGEGRLGATGPLAVDTGEHTGRSPLDKFIVREPESAGEIWWGRVNRPLPPDRFDALRGDVVAHLERRELFVQDLYAGADPALRLRVRVVAESAWHALFARNLFLVPSAAELDADADREPDFTVLHAPRLLADPRRHGVRSTTAIVISLAHRLVVVAGTHYAGEIKKSIFTVMQYVLPRRGVATMHCSANMSQAGEVALFFGLSGTGKTTLSTDRARILIGDDEHGWSERGVFNFEGGSYAKVINLSAEAEPDIFRATHRFGTVLENVVLDPRTRALCLEDDTLTENTRAAFPISFIEGATTTGLGDHPRHLIMLSADATGVLPPVARLSPDQALYYFLSGYTSKLAGTERGITAPEATFSACFGAPFLPLPPVRYAALLRERIDRHRPGLWLVNTGWTGGPVGTGRRMPIALTRAIIHAIVDGRLAATPTEADPDLGLAVPISCPDVPGEMLQPRATWTDPAAYSDAARRLAREFAANFEQFAAAVGPAIAGAGPRPG
jgi:phosphoenolpyruvate carboxykinase (ATP)